MIRAVLAALVLALSGCETAEDVATRLQVLPTLDASTMTLGCCALDAEIPPATDLSLTITKPAQAVEFKGSVHWKF